MHDNTDLLIDGLVEDLEPRRAMRRIDAAILLAIAVACGGGGAIALYGIAANIAQGHASAFFYLASGLLLLLGLAAAASTVRLALPYVGSRADPVPWMLTMAALLPVSAAAMLVPHSGEAVHLLARHDGLLCMRDALLVSLPTALVLFWWLRRGAPVAHARAGMHLGIAATALGTAVYGLTCPNDSLFHLGIWHALPVAIGAMAGLAFGPRLLRW